MAFRKCDVVPGFFCVLTVVWTSTVGCGAKLTPEEGPVAVATGGGIDTNGDTTIPPGIPQPGVPPRPMPPGRPDPGNGCTSDRECPPSMECFDGSCFPRMPGGDPFCDDAGCESGSSGIVDTDSGAERCETDLECAAGLVCGLDFRCTSGTVLARCDASGVDVQALAIPLRAEGGVALAFADAFGDGTDDLVLLDGLELKSTSDLRATSYVRTPLPPGQEGAELFVANLDGNGLEDLVVAGPEVDGTREVSTWLATGDPAAPFRLALSAPQTFRQIAVGDFAGDDGVDDLAGLISFGRGIAIATGRGDGTFAPPSTVSIVPSSYLSAVDIDGDGLSELAYENDDLNVIRLRIGTELPLSGPFHPLDAMVVAAPTDRDPAMVYGLRITRTVAFVHRWGLRNGFEPVQFPDLRLSGMLASGIELVSSRLDAPQVVVWGPTQWAELFILTDVGDRCVDTRSTPFALRGFAVGQSDPAADLDIAITNDAATEVLQRVPNAARMGR